MDQMPLNICRLSLLAGDTRLIQSLCQQTATAVARCTCDDGRGKDKNPWYSPRVRKARLAMYILVVCVYMCACMCACVYVYYIYTHIHVICHSVCIHVYVCVYKTVYMCMHMYIYMHVCIYKYMCIYVYIYIHIHMSVCIYMYTHMYVYIYIYTYADHIDDLYDVWNVQFISTLHPVLHSIICVLYQPCARRCSYKLQKW